MNTDLKTKTICIKNIQFIQFLYPRYIIRNELPVIKCKEDGIIYTGEVSNEVLFNLKSLYGDNYIIVSANNSGINLIRNSDFIKFFFKKKDEEFDNISSSNFFNILKCGIILNKCHKVSEHEKLNIYTLYSKTLENYNNFLHYFFLLEKEIGFEVLMSCLLTFFFKVMVLDVKQNNVFYNKIITRANIKYGSKIKICAFNYVTSSCDKSKLSLFMLVDNILGS